MVIMRGEFMGYRDSPLWAYFDGCHENPTGRRPSVGLTAVRIRSKTVVQQPCVITYSIIEKDTLGNVNQGASAKNQRWLTESLEKKYPGVCYAAPDPSIKIVLVITITPATYNGTRLITNTAETTGNASDNDGNSATYNGTTTSTAAVPYSFDYGKYMLTVETLGPNGKVTVNRRFAQDGMFRTIYGIPLGGRGHHPEKALVEDAVKWMSGGGLSNPFQSAQ